MAILSLIILLNIQHDIGHWYINAGLDRLITVITYLTGLNVFDPTTNFITATQLTDTLPTAVVQSNASVLRI